MLKITYTETGLHLEPVTQSLEDWIAVRVNLALKMGHRLVIDRCSASILLPIDQVDLIALNALQRDALTVDPCDEEFMEVTFHGTWISSSIHPEEGVFLTKVSDRTEYLILKLWQESLIQASSVSR